MNSKLYVNENNKAAKNKIPYLNENENDLSKMQNSKNPFVKIEDNSSIAAIHNQNVKFQKRFFDKRSDCKNRITDKDNDNLNLNDNLNKFNLNGNKNKNQGMNFIINEVKDVKAFCAVNPSKINKESRNTKLNLSENFLESKKIEDADLSCNIFNQQEKYFFNFFLLFKKTLN